MDYMRTGRLQETDFDGMIISLGGRRLSEDDSRERTENCDYALGGAVLELKIVEEEGLEKATRQRKMADLFSRAQVGRPTVVLDPSLLDPAGQQQYYTAMATPVKTHVKKASKQLARSAPLIGPDAPRVLILINGGYGALNHDEFSEIAVNRCTNDTTGIDALIVGGCYHYSDTIDSFLFFPLDLIVLNLGRPLLFFPDLRRAWHECLDNFMTGVTMGYTDREADRMPVVDLEYELDDIRFVKPAPPMGQKSAFFRHGRPRENSTGIVKCPPVARTFPKLSREVWSSLQGCLQKPSFFQGSYSEWCQCQSREDARCSTPLKPFVPVAVDCEGFLAWAERNAFRPSAQRLCEYATEVFSHRLHALIESAVSCESNRLCLPRAIVLEVDEIGQDKANDFGSIMVVSDVRSGDHEQVLVEKHRFFYEHGLALAGAYAIKMDIPTLLYRRNREYVWE